MCKTSVRQSIEAVRERLAELEEALETAEDAIDLPPSDDRETNHADARLVIAALLRRLGGEVTLSHAELVAACDDVEMVDAFGARVVRFARRRSERCVAG
jgi:hypothetical protein